MEAPDCEVSFCLSLFNLTFLILYSSVCNAPDRAQKHLSHYSINKLLYQSTPHAGKLSGMGLGNYHSMTPTSVSEHC